jgi:LCP family protein required for cell wall assembly
MVGKINYSSGVVSGSLQEDEKDVIIDLPQEEEKNVIIDSPQPDFNNLENKIKENLQKDSTSLVYDNDVLNILLIGVDSRKDSVSGRSDSMILLSVNKKTSKIILTSIMRDIYVGIPGYKNNRLNAAYSFGGADLLLKTIQKNFKIEVSKYVTINFTSFVGVIDKLGGVTIDVNQAELPVLNNYVRDNNEILGLPIEDGLLLKSGKGLTLTGKQALGYSRIRYVGNADFERTERQRRVLLQIYQNIKNKNILEQNNILNIILPCVSTNIKKGEIYSILLSLPVYSKYNIEQGRIPIDSSYHGIFVNHMSVLDIDFEKNINEMVSKIYN